MSQSKNLLGSNINLVKSHNLRAILLSLLQDGHVSRVELAKKLSLSNTTITNLTAELLDLGIIVEEDVEVSEKPRNVGRPRRMLRLDPSARYAIGVHIGVGLFRVAVTNLFAEIIHSEIVTFDLVTPPEDVINAISKLRRYDLAGTASLTSLTSLTTRLETCGSGVLDSSFLMVSSSAILSLAWI